jgi:hypothetical protein
MRVGYAHRLPGAPLRDLSLWLTAGLEAEAADGEMFQAISTHVESIAAVAGVRARYHLYSHIAVAARAEVGGVRSSLSLDASQSPELSDAAWGALARVGLELDLFVVEGPRATLGFRLGVGYVRTSAPSLTLRAPDPPSGTLLLPMAATPFGALDLSGPTAAVSIVALF